MADVYLEAFARKDYTKLTRRRPLKLVVNLLGHQLHAPAVRGYGEIGYFRIQQGAVAASARRAFPPDRCH